MDAVRRRERLRAARGLAKALKLLALEDAMTAFFASTGPRHPDALEAAPLISQEMEQLYGRCARDAAWMAGIVAADEATFQRELGRAIQESPLGHEARDSLLRQAVTEGGVVRVVQRAAQELPALAAEEARRRAQQVDAATSGGETTAARSQETRRLVEGVAIGLAMIIGVHGAAASLAVVLADETT